MSILIGDYEFEGPFDSIDHLKELQGLCAVLHFEGEAYELIHLSQAINVRAQIELSKSAYSSVDGTVLLAACYTPKSGTRERKKMIENIQNEFDNRECDKQLLSVAISS